MRKRGFRGVFSLLLAVMMVCTMLPTAAFAEGNVEPTIEVTEQPTEQVMEQPGEQLTPEQPTGQPEGGEAQQPTEKEEAPQGEQPATPPQTYTVVYVDGAENTVFEAKSFPGLTSGVPTPAFGGDPIRDGYTFLGWEPALAETVTGDVTYTAKWEAVEEATDGALTTYALGAPDVGDDAYGISEYKPQSKLTITFYVVANGNEYNIGTEVSEVKGRYSEFECEIPDLTEFVSRNAYGKITDIQGSWYKPNQNKRVKIGDTVKWKDNTQSKDAYVKYYVDTYLVTGESWPITYRILYVSDDFNVGYNYGTKYETSFVCQYTEPHSNTASVSHSLAEADIKAAADYLASSVNEGYEIVGWTKKDSANPPVYDLKTSGTTVWAANNTIYIVAKKTVVNTDYNFTLVYNNNAEDAVGGPGSDSYRVSSSQSSLSHTFTISNVEPTREGYTFQGWSDTADGGVNYTAGGSYTMNATKDSPNPAATLYAVWEEEEITYTVTYTDGVEGEEVFQDRVYSGLKKDAQTPAFNTDGTAPTRSGYTFAGWNPEVAPTVTGDRIYTATWKPALPDAIFGSFIMKCVTTPRPSHYLIDGFDINLAPLNEYTNSGVQKDESGDTPTYYFELTVDAEKYLPQYDREAAPTAGGPIAHTIHDASQAHPVIRYNWNGTTWEQANKPLVEVKCTPAPATFTVTYTDGVDGEEVFADQSHTVESGKPTPAFNGTPTRKGYTFAGWEPTVAETVTDDATYVAQWTKNAPAKPEGDELPQISVTVDCVNTSVTHSDKTYNLLNDCYTVTDPTPGENGVYGCAIEIDGQKYVDHYSGETDINCAHSLVTVDTQSQYVYVYLKAVETDTGYQWIIDEEKGSSASVTFKAMCDVTPPTDKPEAPNVNDLLKDKWVGITCKYVPTHQRGFEWVDNSYATKEENVVSDGKGGYTYTVTILPNAYIAACNAWIPNMPHTLVGPESVDVTLTWNKETESWEAPEEDVIAMFTVTCKKTVTPPPAPSHDDLSKLIGDIIVRCTNNAATHEPKSKGYALIENSYTTGNGVEGDAENGYTYTVTIKSEKYVDQFDTDTGATHGPKDGTATVVLKYRENGWAVESGTPVAFNVSCKTETIPPQKPTDEDLKNLSVPPVDVKCTTKEGHTASYELLKDSYGIGDVVGNESSSYTCDVTVYAEEYVKKFCKTKYGPHLLDDNDRKTLTLKYVNGEWTTDEWVTFEVKCAVPAKPTENDLAGIKVFVQCTNSGATHGDKRKEYGLIGTDGYYYVGDPTFLESDGKYHCTVNVNGERYVAKYSTDTGVQHTYMAVDTVYKYAYLTATWTDGGYVWSVDETGSTVTFDARCETVPPAQTFTVTYKDGVAGKAFQDQSYTVPSGSATPAFNGTPYLAGYVFTGWTPDVAATVTANATYIASWKLDTNNNGKPDDEEERYTVTYADGAGGKAFADQVYTGLLSGTSTPKFNGSPVRAGYYFTGWSPKLSATVTGNVTYTATWTKAYGGLDNVPKTGDNGLTLALSALLLFSFCGAAACVVSTKKRG